MTRLFAIITSLEDLATIAQDIAACRHTIPAIALIGNLGSGKTTFSQYFGRALGINDLMHSPTFTLVNEYTLPSQERLVHADLYRLHAKPEIHELGLGDHFSDPNTTVLVEWADRLPELFPHGTLTITLDNLTTHRVMSLHCENPDFWHHLEARRLPR